LKNIAEITFCDTKSRSSQYLDYFMPCSSVEVENSDMILSNVILELINKFEKDKYMNANFLYCHRDLRSKLLGTSTVEFNVPDKTCTVWGCILIHKKFCLDISNNIHRIIVSENELVNFDGCSHYKDTIKVFETGT